MAEEAFKGKTREEADLVKAGRLAQVRVKRALTRRDSLLGYRPNFKAMELPEGEEKYAVKKQRLKHASSINLRDETPRQLHEEKFNIEL